jgi:hypothetical protein
VNFQVVRNKVQEVAKEGGRVITELKTSKLNLEVSGPSCVQGERVEKSERYKYMTGRGTEVTPPLGYLLGRQEYLAS